MLTPSVMSFPCRSERRHPKTDAESILNATRRRSKLKRRADAVRSHELGDTHILVLCDV